MSISSKKTYWFYTVLPISADMIKKLFKYPCDNPPTRQSTEWQSIDKGNPPIQKIIYILFLIYHVLPPLQKMPYKKYFLHSFRLNLSNKGIDAVLACLLVALLTDEWWFFAWAGDRATTFFRGPQWAFIRVKYVFSNQEMEPLRAGCCPSCFIVRNAWAVPSLHAGLKNWAPNPIPKLLTLEEFFLLLFIHFQSRA